MTSSEDIWFSGPVKDAVSLVAERNCTFLVYIHDDSDKSNIFNATLKNENVIQAIKKYTIALSMDNESENAKLFGQYYPTKTVPILYLIKQGTIKDFGIETVSSEELVDKIVKVNELSTPAVSNPNTEQQHQQQSVAPAVPVLEQNPTTSTTSEPPASLATDENNKAKKAELQKQLEQVRKERAEREREESKEREIKRRQEAKLMQEANQSRVDKENKIYFDKIKKERMEDEAHRKKVRQQIATDRAEKIAQRNAEKQRQNSSTSSLENEVVENKVNRDHDSSYLNIRQLDGNTIRHKFEASVKLSEVKDWIKENRTDDSKKPYKLSSQFPTRLFTEADNDVSLTDLNLCPSAIIIMKPIKSSYASSISLTSSNRNGIVGYVVRSFDYVYGFLIALINIVAGLLASLFPTGGPAPHTLPASQQQQPILRNLRGGQRLGGEPVSGNSSGRAESSSSKDEPSSSAKKRNPYATRVNTLQEDDKDDDEKRSTYNGNSVNHE